MKSRKRKTGPVRAKRYRQQKPGSKHLGYDPLEARRLLAADMLVSTVNFLGGGSDLIRFDEPIAVESSAEVLRNHLGLGQNESLRLLSSKTDSLGFEHLKYQQFYNQIPVEGSSYTLHVLQDQVVSMSGDRVGVQSPISQIEVSQQEALEIALDHIGADTYAWQDPVMSGIIGYDGAPSGELVYLTNLNGQSAPVYKFDIYAMAPESRDYVYVNAFNGDVELVASRIRGADTPAHGVTHYYGDRDFLADSFVDGNGNSRFRLRQVTNGVETYDNQRGPIGNFTNAIDVTSSSVDFTDPANTSGVTAHWGTEQFMDYLLTVHGRDSYDDAGATMISYVNVSNNLVNAFWNGSVMQYGEGNGNDIGPLVALDIVGHEITHGVTEYSSNLVYANEPGALNESFSDIFGEALQYYATGAADWRAGATIFFNTGSGIRNYADPNEFNDPDTYLGDFWFTGGGDNGGVHTNSGVQNKWFYVLSEGEAGINDKGDAYDVTGIGIEDAAAIAYRNLTVYLSVNSQYQDARDGAVQAAIDLFGAGSQQHISTNQAWRAVGLVGDEIEIYDMDPVLPGSLIYSFEEVSTVETTGPRPVILRAEGGQRLAVEVTSRGGLEPTIEVRDPSDTVIATATHTNGVAAINGLDLPTAGSYTIYVDGDNSTTGEFDLLVLLNGDLELESTLGSSFNNDPLSAENINGSSYALDGSADRLGVVGRIGLLDGTLADGDDFESGSLGGQWTTHSTDSLGRIQVTDLYGAGGGTQALIMDQQVSTIFNLNEAIWTVDVGSLQVPILSFKYAEFNDENHPLPVTFNNSFNGDGVAISEDGVVWHTILTDTETAAGAWRPFALNLADFAQQAGLSLDGQLQIKFQQYDDDLIGDDGRGYDEIMVREGATSDWYSFDALAGQTLALAVGNSSGTGSLQVDVFDSAGNLVGLGQPGLSVASHVIPFSAPATDTYFARVSGVNTDYGMVVTRDIEFDTGSATGQVQELNGNLLGNISAVSQRNADPDAAADKTVINTFFDGVVFSNEVTGGDVFAVAASQYIPPTGLNVFGPSITGSAGWQEGVNELRADFDIWQTTVSIDVGSADVSGDIGFLRAYDESGALLDEAVSQVLFSGERQTLTVADPNGEIAYVIAGGVGNDVTPLDNLRYEIASPASDHYQIKVNGGDSMTIQASFPGTDPLLFDNRLVVNGTVNLRIEVYNSFGSMVANGQDSVSFESAQSDDYTIKVYTVSGEGDYVLNLNVNEAQKVYVGNLNRGVAAPDDAVGEGYLMFSVQNVHDRFNGKPHVFNADHILAVRYNQGTQRWQYSDNVKWINFKPLESDRLLAHVDFSADTATALAEVSGRVRGIRQGYYDGDLAFIADMWNGLPNDGEFGITGTYFIPRDQHVFVGDLGMGLPAPDQDTGTAYVMYSEHNVFERFSYSPPHFANAAHLIVVRYEDGAGTWQFSQNDVWRNFSPQAGDRLVAELDLGADSVTLFEGVSGRIEGLAAGYIESDLAIIPNSFGGSTNDGEFEATGTFFRFNDLVRNLGDVGSGVAVSDGATGTGFLMYSAENVFDRFSGSLPDAGNAAHLIAVRYDTALAQWQYNDNANWVAFDPVRDDVLLAELDFDADTASVLTTPDVYFGIIQGMIAGDLAITANQYGGASDSGEFEIAGTFFEHDNVTFGAGPINRGVGVADDATGLGFLMYSATNVHARFGGAPNIYNANHFIAVRYDAIEGWQFNDNFQWVNFTIADDDRLVAAIDFDNDTIDSLLNSEGVLQGIGVGFRESDLVFQADRWNGVFNNGEFSLTGTYFVV